MSLYIAGVLYVGEKKDGGWHGVHFSGSPVNKQKLANQMQRGKEVGVAETSLTRVSGTKTRQYNFDTLLA